MADPSDLWSKTKRFAAAAGEGAYDASKSMVEDVTGLVKGAGQLATDPSAREEAWQATKQMAETATRYTEAAWKDPAKPFLDARDAALNAYNQFEEARLDAEAKGRSIEFWGEIAGGAGVEIITSAVGGVVAKGVSKGARRVRALTKSADGAADTSRNIDAAATARAVLEEPALDAPDAKPNCVTECVTKQPGPSGKRWTDPTMTAEEFIRDYRARYPNTRLRDEKLRQAFDSGQRLDPESGRLKVARYRAKEGFERTEPLPAPGTPAYENWKKWEWGNPKTVPCFPAGTLVKAPGGDVSIDTLVPGMQVYAFDLMHGAVVSTVTSVHRHHAVEMVLIETPFAHMYATPNHPYWVEQEAAWIVAGQLRPGMQLRLLHGGCAPIRSVERYAAHEASFNITVMGQHTYYVSEAGFLVHNSEPPESAYASGIARDIIIYRVTNKETGEVYIGQTQQGLHSRLLQHVHDPKSALFIENPVDRENWETIYGFKRLDNGRWTDYEAAVWEQHYIDVERAAKSSLLNRQNGITSIKAGKFRDLHNPCR
jgi:hypothetical protein